MGHQIPLQVSFSEQVAQLPLFDRFPELGKQLSHVSLGSLFSDCSEGGLRQRFPCMSASYIASPWNC